MEGTGIARQKDTKQGGGVTGSAGLGGTGTLESWGTEMILRGCRDDKEGTEAATEQEDRASWRSLAGVAVSHYHYYQYSLYMWIISLKITCNFMCPGLTQCQPPSLSPPLTLPGPRLQLP